MQRMHMKATGLCLGAALLLVANLAFADKPSITDSKAFVDCMSADFDDSPAIHRMKCIKVEIRKYQTLLDAEYQQQLRFRKGKSRQRLIQVQREWIKYRNAWCEFEFTLEPGGNPYVNQQFCLADQTIDQWYKLKSIRDLPSWQ